MIGPNFDFRGFDATAWDRLLSIVRQATHAAIGGTVVVTVDDQGRSIGALHTGAGRIDRVDLLEDLSLLCNRLDARRCIVLHERALTEIAERASIRIHPEDDYADQWLTILRIARELRAEGRIRTWPDNLFPWHVVSPQLLHLGANLLLPNGHTVVLALFENREIWTCAVLRRQNDLIDLLVGPDEVRRWVGPLGGAWRRDYRVICEAVERHVGPLQLGVFAEAETARRLLSDQTPGRWAVAVTMRDLVLNPSPPWLSVALGADGLLGMASTWTERLMGLDGAQTRDYLKAVLRGFTEGESLPNLLQWEPVRLIVQAIQGDPEAPPGEELERDRGDDPPIGPS